mmetsp:Transcript_12886/g.25014  ORF Transcript_12886/g.25014 Transcript_12886/m.25014 type:complete len:358 (-) Transcript_12886:212-1285(-)
MPSCASCSIFVVVLAILAMGLFNVVSDGKSRMYWPPPQWSIEDIPSLEGQTALVTGANVGLGYASSLELLKKGCVVIVATRSPAKNVDTAKKLQAEASLPEKYRSNVVAPKVGLELNSLASVEKFADSILEDHKSLNILLNNAGIMMTPYGLTKDGYEQQFGVNHVGHYALTLRLMPLLEAGAPSRVVAVTSLGHRFASSDALDFDKLNDEASYSPTAAYGRSKLANILFARALARRVNDKQIYVNAAHPGFVATELARHVKDSMFQFLSKDNIEYFMQTLTNMVAMTPTEGATTQLYLCMPEIAKRNITGEYYVPTARKHDSHPLALSGPMSDMAKDDVLAEKLWAWTAKETGLDL